MKLDKEQMLRDGITKEEIEQIEEQWDAAEQAGTADYSASTVQINHATISCPRTMAEILDELRPGCWIDRPKSGGAPQRKPPRKGGSKRRMRKGSLSKRQRADNQIKVHFTYPNPDPSFPGGEFLWARRISKNTAKIENIPFFTSRIASGDLVQFDDDGEIVKVLEHATRTRALVYADREKESEEAIQERYGQVREALDKHDIHCEGMFPGVCSISVPLDLGDEQLEELADELDCQLILHEDDENDEDDE